MKAIEIIVRGVLFCRAHLLVCRNRRTGRLYLPGGHVEPGEAARAALQREIREELGRASRAGRFVAAVEHAFRQQGRGVAELNLLFVLRVPGLRPERAVPSCEPKLEFLWLPVAELGRSALEPAPCRRRLATWTRRRAGAARERWASTLEGCGLAGRGRT